MDLDQSKNIEVCKQNIGNTQFLTIDTSIYSDYKYVFSNSAYRGLTIFGLINLIIIAVILVLVNKFIIDKKKIWIMLASALVLNIISLCGFGGFLNQIKDTYVLSDHIQITDNPHQTTPCNITYGFYNKDNIYSLQFKDGNLGMIKFTIAIFLIINIIYFIIIIIESIANHLAF